MDLSVEEIRVRFISSSILVVLFNTVFVLVSYVVKNLSFSIPCVPTWNEFRIYTCFGTLFLLIVNTCLATVAVKHLFLHLTVSDIVHFKNYETILPKFSGRRVRFFLICFVLGVFQTWTLVKITESSSASSTVWRLSWLLLYGGCMSYLFAVNSVTQNLLTLNFEHDPVSLFEIFTNVVRKHFLRTLGRIIYFIALFTLFYCLICGGMPFGKGLFAHLDSGFLFEMFSVGFYIHASWSASLVLLQTTLTQNLTFSIEQDSLVSVTVTDLVNESSTGILHHLTLGRLAAAVAQNTQTRAQIFNVTDPNGHVVIWQRVSSCCLDKLDVFLSGLHKVNKQISASSSACLGKTMKIDKRGDGPPSHGTNFATRNDMVSVVKSLAECTTQVLNFARGLPGLRHLLQDIPFAETCRLLSSGGGCFLQKAAEATIHASNKAARQSGQAVIWCTEILGCLTLASYTEDSLGSVQSALGLIIGTLDEILEALELHFHLVGLVSSKNMPLSDFLHADAAPLGSLDKGPGEVGFFSKSSTRDWSNETRGAPYYRYASDPLLPWRIHATVKWALNNCVLQFGDHLRTIQIDVRRRRRLEQLWNTLSASNTVVF